MQERQGTEDPCENHRSHQRRLVAVYVREILRHIRQLICSIWQVYETKCWPIKLGLNGEQYVRKTQGPFIRYVGRKVFTKRQRNLPSPADVPRDAWDATSFTQYGRWQKDNASNLQNSNFLNQIGKGQNERPHQIRLRIYDSNPHRVRPKQTSTESLTYDLFKSAWSQYQGAVALG